MTRTFYVLLVAAIQVGCTGQRTKPADGGTAGSIDRDGGAEAAWRPQRSPAAKPVTPPDGTTVVATWPGGKLTVQEVADALGHRAPAFDYALLNPNAEGMYREDFVAMLGRAKQLDALAISRGASQETMLGRLRTLAEFKLDAGNDYQISQVIDSMTKPVLVVDPAALKALTPTRWPWVARHELEQTIMFTTFNGAFSELCLTDGSRVLDLASARGRPPTLSPQTLLAMELMPDVEEFADDRNEVFHATGAGRANAPVPPPFGNGCLSLDSVDVDGLSAEDARQAWARVQTPLTRCLAMAAWDNRWDLSHVAIRAFVEEGQMTGSAPRFEVVTAHGAAPGGKIGVSPRNDTGEYCGLVLSRWPFPTNATGTATFHTTLTVSGFDDNQAR